LIFFEGHLLAPGLVSPLLAGALWCLLAAGKRSRPLLALPTGLLMGLSMMGRPNLALLLPVGFIWLLLRFKAWKGRALVAGLAGLGVLAGFAPSTIHNALHGGGLSPVSSAGGISFYLGNNPQATGRFHVPRGEHIDASSHASYRRTLETLAERKLGRRLSASEVSGYWWGRGFAFWAERPGAALALTGRKLLLALNSQEQPIHHPFDFGREISPVLRFCLPFGVLFAFAAVGGLFGRRRLTGVGLLSLCAGVYLLSLVIFYVADRYRVAVLPMLAPLFACGVLALAERFRQGGFARIAPALGVLALAFGLTQLPLTSQAERDRILSAGWMRLGVAAGQRGDLDQAQAALERAVELAGPGRAATARLNLGILHLKRKRLVDAARLFSEAAVADPIKSRPWVLLARLAERQGQLELAISHWAQAAKRSLDPSSAQNQIQRLRLLLAARELAEPGPRAP
jgi:tetratricopeptide (TPR) repeat protein